MEKIVTPEGMTYEPFVTNETVGYKVIRPDGSELLVYLAPSTETGEGPGSGNIFAYCDDDAITHLNVAAI